MVVYNARFRVRDSAVPDPAISVICLLNVPSSTLWYVNVNVLELP